MVRTPIAALVAVLAVAWAAPAHALEFGTSTATGKSVTMVPFRTSTSNDMPVGVELGLRWVPSLTDVLGNTRPNPQWGEVSSMMIDADADLDVNFRLADVGFGMAGRFKPIITPYFGYRYLGVPTAELTDPRAALGAGNLGGAAAAGSAISYNQFGGLNYGVRATLEMPLGFEAHAGLGLTTLVSGGWDTRRYDASSFVGGKAPSTDVTGAGRISVGGTTLPGFNIGASWNLLHALTLSVGYETLVLPTDLRLQTGTLGAGKATVNNLTVGVQLFTFSI